MEILGGISARSHFKSVPVLLLKAKETPRGGLCEWAETREEEQQGSLRDVNSLQPLQLGKHSKEPTEHCERVHLNTCKA